MVKGAILATQRADLENGNINSIVKLLALGNPAAIPNLEGNKKESFAIEILQSEMRDIKRMMEMLAMESRREGKGSITAVEFDRISTQVDRIASSKRMPRERQFEELKNLLMQAEELMMIAEDKASHMLFRNLMRRIQEAMENIA